MFERLAEIEARFAELTEQLADPEIASDYRRVKELNLERTHLAGVVKRYRSLRETESARGAARGLLGERAGEAGAPEQAEISYGRQTTIAAATPIVAAAESWLVDRESARALGDDELRLHWSGFYDVTAGAIQAYRTAVDADPWSEAELEFAEPDPWLGQTVPLDADDVLGAIRSELVPWALLTGDAVLARVTKRNEIEIRPEDLR